MSEIFFIDIKNGKWEFTHKGHFDGYCKSKPDGRYALREPAIQSKKRSLKENDWYRGRCRQLASVTGHTVDQIHEILMFDCGFIKSSIFFGIEKIIRLSSTELTHSEWSRLIKKQDEYTNEYNSDLPPDKWLILMTGDPLVEFNKRINNGMD